MLSPQGLIGRHCNWRDNLGSDLSEHICLKNARATIGAAEVNMAALPLSRNNETGIVPALGQHSVPLRKEFAL